MKGTQKKTLINTGLLVGFCIFAVGFFTENNIPETVGLVILGLVITIFHRELAGERYAIDKATKNEFLKKHLFGSETVEKNQFVFLIGGIIFLVVGCLMFLSVLFS